MHIGSCIILLIISIALMTVCCILQLRNQGESFHQFSIWITHKSIDRTFYVQWTEKNPATTINFLDDAQVHQQFVDAGDPELLEAFDRMPLPVMKADMWRYLVVHRYGGMYVDADVECLVPVSEWELDWDRYDVFIDFENDVHFCQWIFLAKPNHPLFGLVLDMIKRKAKTGIDFTDEHFVHSHTGPCIWTDAIISYVGSSQDLVAKYHKQAKQFAHDYKHEFSQKRICIFPQLTKVFTIHRYHGGNTDNGWSHQRYALLESKGIVRT